MKECGLMLIFWYKMWMILWVFAMVIRATVKQNFGKNRIYVATTLLTVNLKDVGGEFHTSIIFLLEKKTLLKDSYNFTYFYIPFSFNSQD